MAGVPQSQTTLLAPGSRARRPAVAHIVYPVRSSRQSAASLEVVQRPPRARRRDVTGRAGGDARRLASAGGGRRPTLRLRTGLSGGIAAFVVGALFCFIRPPAPGLGGLERSRLSSSSALTRSRLTEAMYRLALRQTRRIVVQSEQQLGLARTAVGDSGRVSLIPSFAEPAEDEATPAQRDAFLWGGGRDWSNTSCRCATSSLPGASRGALRDGRTDHGETTQALEQQLAAETARRSDILEILAHLRRERTLELMRRSIAVVGHLSSRGNAQRLPRSMGQRRTGDLASTSTPTAGSPGRDGNLRTGLVERFVEAARTLREDQDLRAALGDKVRRYVAGVHSPAAVGRSRSPCCEESSATDSLLLSLGAESAGSNRSADRIRS